MYYAYLLLCADGSLYAGYTDELLKRLSNHNAGHGAKYTKGRLPVSLVYWEAFETKSQAMRRECAIKKLKRAEKLALIREKEADN
ncbi:MAG: GIY-YIG nuclease family protein [Candidatus Pelethousia sp.]|nr:GIY-YIG nuclease family protein [Candidatus Pelethousia sp.]